MNFFIRNSWNSLFDCFLDVMISNWILEHKIDWFWASRNFHNIKSVANNLRRSHPVGICMFKVNKRNTRTRCEICSKLTIKIFATFTGKQLPQGLFFNNVAGLRPATLLKKRLWHRWFPVDFAEFLRTPFLQNTSGWLLLKVVSDLMLHENNGFKVPAELCLKLCSRN